MAEAKQSIQDIFTFPFNDAHEVISIGVALPAVCILVVSLRFSTRLLQNIRTGLDDWLSLGGLVSPAWSSGCDYETDAMTIDRSPSLEWAPA